jgi:cell division initiation protein
MAPTIDLMELSPELLTNVTFGEQFRGYREDEVDDFLERVAAAVADLLGRLREAERRAGEAERALAEQAANDEIRRTLLLAQRTAATAVDEAKAEAARILTTAETDAAEQIAAAESRLARIEVEIDQREREQLGMLAERRAALEGDIASLTAFARDHRAALRAALEVQLQAIDGTAFDTPAPPATSGVVIGAGPTSEDWAADPEVAAARADLLTALAAVAASTGIDEWVAADAVASPEAAPEEIAHGRVADAPVIAAEQVEPPALFDDAVVDARDSTDDTADRELAAAVEAPPDDLPEALEPPVASPVDDEPVEWRRTVISDEPDDDPFLTELRRAVTDTEPLGPRELGDDSDSPGFDLEGDDELAPPGRFRLRRSRR